ncbi:MAG: hypothetical protein M5U34_17140 [Chloroflexi bacterium]|nr:hypothetical protein [Chloroflexota bacterium]
MTQFRLPMEYDEALVTALLEPETAVLPQEAINEKWTLYDTFDWRLYKQALALYSSGNQFVLRDLARGETAVQAELAETPQFVGCGARAAASQTFSHFRRPRPPAPGPRAPPANHLPPFEQR